MFVRITGVPPGEAPEEVRRAWVGLVLPLAEGESGPRVFPGFGVLSGKPVADAEGRYLGTPQFVVPAGAAVTLLEWKAPEAAAWWRDNAPHAITTGMLFGFDAEVCEQVSDRDGFRPRKPRPALLEVAYTTALKDVVACTLRIQQSSPTFKRQYVVGWVVVPVAGLVAAVLVFFFVHWLFVAPILVLATYYAIFYPLMHRRGAERSVRRYLQELGTRGLVGHVTLLLTDETLTYRTETVESVARWADMKGVKVVEDCTYILLSGLQVAVIPRHGFEREEDYAAVRDFVADRLPKLS